MIKKFKTNLSAFELYTIFKDDDHNFILDSAMDEENLGRYSFISANPFEILKYKDEQVKPLEELRKKMRKYRVDNDSNLPFIGGAVGYLSYDLCHYIDDLPVTTVDDINIPDLYLGLYDWVIVIDHLNGEKYLATPGLNESREKKLVDQIYTRIKESEVKGIDPICYETTDYLPVKIRSNFTRKDYLATIDKVKDYIKAGDIYQANLSQRFRGEVSMSSYELYRDLRKISPAPFGAFLNFNGVDILSNSPERFIQKHRKIIQTRPIKGTRPRGETPEEDLRLKDELLNSEKDKSELLMIVDLERNDLGRVSKIGTVRVPELFKLEEYANVHHLVSTVVGELKNELDLMDLIKAVFPGGSITGAPKIRSMEIIDELEPTRRSVYTGAIGYLGFDDSLDLNIVIRTIIKKNSTIYFQVGGGITWDSNTQEEYDETLHKAESIMKAVRGYYEE